MLNLAHLKIQTKLRMMGLAALLSVLALGFISNYFFQTAKVLGIIINAEKVHDSSFQEGAEDYYKYLLTDNLLYLDSAQRWIQSANQMAYNYATIDQLLRLPREKYIDILMLGGTNVLFTYWNRVCLAKNNPD